MGDYIDSINGGDGKKYSFLPKITPERICPPYSPMKSKATQMHGHGSVPESRLEIMMESMSMTTLLSKPRTM